MRKLKPVTPGELLLEELVAFRLDRVGGVLRHADDGAEPLVLRRHRALIALGGIPFGRGGVALLQGVGALLKKEIGRDRQHEREHHEDDERDVERRS